MSELTVNIADYRPLWPVRPPERLHAMKPHSGFILIRPNSEPREYEPRWFDPQPAVVEIRSVRDSRRMPACRAKILRFSNPQAHRIYTMPAPESQAIHQDDDPGPLVA